MTDERKDGQADGSGGPVPQDGKSSPSSPPKPKRERKPPTRGKAALDAGLSRLVRLAGKNMAAPDTTAVERHIRRSERIQRLIAEYLSDNVGSAWVDLPELHARAANYAGCAMPTAARWVYQLTRVGQAFKIVEAVDHWMLVRRD